MNREITISAMWRTLKRSFIVILVVAVLAMACAALFTKFVIEEKFSSSVAFYVVNVSVDEEYITSSLIAANENLANTYIRIIQSDDTIEKIVNYLEDEYGRTYTSAQVISMMSTAIDGESSTFDVKIASTDKEVAFVIARYIAENAPDIIKNFVTPSVSNLANDKLNIERVKVLSVPTLDEIPDSPNLIKNVFLAGFCTAVIVYLVCLIVALCNPIIKNEYDLKMVITSKYNLIGTVPNCSGK